MRREQNEVIAGNGRGGNQFASARTGKCAACEQPETSSNPARPRCAHGSALNPAVLHGRALSVGPTVPKGIITLGCSVALGLSGGKALTPGAVARQQFVVIPRSRPSRHSLQYASQRRTRFLSFLLASVRLPPIVLFSSAQIVTVHRSHGYWTSVQSIDRMRWRSV